MCTWIISKRIGLIDFTYGNILHGRRREQVKRYQLMVRIGRSNRQPVQCRRAVTVTQSAYNDLSSRSNRHTGNLLYAFFYIGNSLCTHFLRPDIFDSYTRLLTLHHQRTFILQIFFSYHRKLIKLLIIGSKCYNQLILLSFFYNNFLRLIRNILYNQRTCFTFYIFNFEPSVDISNNSCRGSTYLNSCSDKRFFRWVINNHTF